MKRNKKQLFVIKIKILHFIELLFRKTKTLTKVYFKEKTSIQFFLNLNSSTVRLNTLINTLKFKTTHSFCIKIETFV